MPVRHSHGPLVWKSTLVWKGERYRAIKSSTHDKLITPYIRGPAQVECVGTNPALTTWRFIMKEMKIALKRHLDNLTRYSIVPRMEYKLENLLGGVVFAVKPPRLRLGGFTANTTPPRRFSITKPQVDRCCKEGQGFLIQCTLWGWYTSIGLSWCTHEVGTIDRQ